MNCTRLPGDIISRDLTWHQHINEIAAKASQRLYFINLLKRAGVESHHIVNQDIYNSHPLRHRVRLPSQKNPQKTAQTLQKRAMCIVFRGMSYNDAVGIARLPTLADWREYAATQPQAAPSPAFPQHS